MPSSLSPGVRRLRPDHGHAVVVVHMTKSLPVRSLEVRVGREEPSVSGSRQAPVERPPLARRCQLESGGCALRCHRSGQRHIHTPPGVRAGRGGFVAGSACRSGTGGRDDYAPRHYAPRHSRLLDGRTSEWAASLLLIARAALVSFGKSELINQGRTQARNQRSSKVTARMNAAWGLLSQDRCVRWQRDWTRSGARADSSGR